MINYTHIMTSSLACQVKAARTVEFRATGENTDLHRN